MATSPVIPFTVGQRVYVFDQEEWKPALVNNAEVWPEPSKAIPMIEVDLETVVSPFWLPLHLVRTEEQHAATLLVQ